MRATGLAIKRVDLVSIQTRRGLDMRETGRKTSNTAKAMKPGQREPATGANILGAKKKDVASILGVTDQFMKVSGKTTKSTALESTFGLTAGNTTDSG